MIGALLRWLPLSLAIHAAALATTAFLPHEETLAPLFVDLTLDAKESEPSPPGGRRSGDGRPAPAQQQARRATQGPGRGVATPPAVSPSVTPPPTAAPPAAIPPVDAPPVTPSVVTAPPEAAPPVVVSTPSSAPSPGPATAEPSRETASGGNGAGGAASGTASAAPGGGDVAGAGGSASASGGGEGRASGTGEGMLALAIPGDDGGAYGAYLALLRRRVQQSLTYPAAARRRSIVGTVHLEIALEASGRITEVTLVRSSSHAILDEAALDGVRALRRVPFPSDVRPRPLRVRLPVVFELR